jgi:hypothetical protein
MRLLAIAPSDGAVSVVSDTGTGGGIAWTTPDDLAWDTPNSRVLLANRALAAVVSVDPASGDRVALSGGTAGSGTAFTSPTLIAVDGEHQRALVVDGTQVIAVELGTGKRSLFSGTGTGSGPDLVKPVRVVLDGPGERLLVLDLGDSSVAPSLLAIALADGTRSAFADVPARWYGSSDAQTFAYDSATQIAYLGELHAIDTTNGQSIEVLGHRK